MTAAVGWNIPPPHTHPSLAANPNPGASAECAGWWELMKSPCKKGPHHVSNANHWTLGGKGPTWAPSPSRRRTETAFENKLKKYPKHHGVYPPTPDLGPLKEMGRDSVFLTKQNQQPKNKTHELQRWRLEKSLGKSLYVSNLSPSCFDFHNFFSFCSRGQKQCLFSLQPVSATLLPSKIARVCYQQLSFPTLSLRSRSF